MNKEQVVSRVIDLNRIGENCKRLVYIQYSTGPKTGRLSMSVDCKVYKTWDVKTHLDAMNILDRYVHGYVIGECHENDKHE